MQFNVARYSIALLGALASSVLVSATATGQQATALRTLMPIDSTIINPTLSPSGQWILATKIVSNSEYRLLAGRAPNGPLREVSIDRGRHLHPMLTTTGDRLVFVSSLPQRNATDNALYIVSAPFDNKTGTVTGPIRQVSLEAVRGMSLPRLRPVVSPDGKWVAYVTCCGEADELRIVPITGGASKLIARGGKLARQQPGLIVWSRDSRSLSYELRDGDANASESIVYLASIDGGTAKVISRLSASVTAISPDRRLFVVSSGGPRPRLRFLSADGNEVASIATPQRILMPNFSADGTRLIGLSREGGNILKIVSASGGAVRTLGNIGRNEWPVGWEENAIDVQSIEGGKSYARLVAPDGAIVRSTEVSDPNKFDQWQGHLRYEERIPKTINRVRVMVQDRSGNKRVLVDNALGGCCDPVGPGGDYWKPGADEMLVRTVRGNQVEIRGIRIDGRSRVVGTLPAGLPTTTYVAVHGEKLVYTELRGDSSFLRLISGRNRAPRTLMARAAQPGFGEFSWSHGGNMLAMYTGGTPQRIHIFRFDQTGATVGEPQVIDPPFEYFYEMFWRPDDSGLSMIAQPRGATLSEIAILPLNAPGSPTYVTKSDLSNKWGHSPSPDGKWIAYPSEWVGAGAIVEVDLAKLIGRAGGKR